MATGIRHSSENSPLAQCDGDIRDHSYRENSFLRIFIPCVISSLKKTKQLLNDHRINNEK